MWIKKKRKRLPWKPDYGPSRREAKAIEYRARRQSVREQAFELDKHRCVFCQKRLDLDAAHMHEIEWRGFGGDPLDIDNVVTLCDRCHGQIHPRVGGKLKKITGSRIDGIRLFEKEGEEWREVQTL